MQAPLVRVPGVYVRRRVGGEYMLYLDVNAVLIYVSMCGLECTVIC